ncbi:MAG: type I-E CRISPR-associated endonuclease Cas1e [Anaerolineales bacterium]|nr:type I-E CRISPR-associated endonuclease Cas1e [Anaerolineales bacterium]
MQDLHQLPKLSDSISYLYVEHCVIEQNALAIEQIDKRGRTMIPVANLTVLLLGPGTSITHAAIKSLADNGCGILWVGEDATHFYAHGSGETRRAYHLLHQARLASDPELRQAVCQRMYSKRFKDGLETKLTIKQLRGKEGARVRMAYEKASILYNVPWHGRNYDRNSWGKSDNINRALSAAHALLYGICHAAIVSGGYSPALGFIHTGKQRSFVFDIADLYKAEVTIPVAFQVVSESPHRIEARVRKACRAAFKKAKLLQQILPDIADLLDLPDDILNAASESDVDMARPEPLWTPPEEEMATENPDALVPHLPVPAAIKKTISTPLIIDPPPLTPIPFAPKEEKSPLELRRERAKKGLAGKWKVERLKHPNTWRVITRSGPPGYIVYEYEGHLSCNCPDYDRNELDACKHTIATQIWRDREAT